MPLQYSLGLEPPKRPTPPAPATWTPTHQPTSKLLILAKPDEETATRIARTANEIAARLGFEGKLVRSDLLHFTLHHIGTFSAVPQSIVTAVGECGDAIRMLPFTVSLTKVQNFRRRSGIPLIVLCGDDGVVGLRVLREKLGVALAKRFGSVRSSSFEPHMTLSYRAMEISDISIAPINFTIHEFVLVNSLQGQGRHDVLLRWRLGA